MTACSSWSEIPIETREYTVYNAAFSSSVLPHASRVAAVLWETSSGERDESSDRERETIRLIITRGNMDGVQQHDEQIDNLLVDYRSKNTRSYILESALLNPKRANFIDSGEKRVHVCSPILDDVEPFPEDSGQCGPVVNVSRVAFDRESGLAYFSYVLVGNLYGPCHVVMKRHDESWVPVGDYCHGEGYESTIGWTP